MVSCEKAVCWVTFVSIVERRVSSRVRVLGLSDKQSSPPLSVETFLRTSLKLSRGGLHVSTNVNQNTCATSQAKIARQTTKWPLPLDHSSKA
jgi:hypothetical protein